MNSPTVISGQGGLNGHSLTAWAFFLFLLTSYVARNAFDANEVVIGATRGLALAVLVMRLFLVKSSSSFVRQCLGLLAIGMVVGLAVNPIAINIVFCLVFVAAFGSLRLETVATTASIAIALCLAVVGICLMFGLLQNTIDAGFAAAADGDTADIERYRSTFGFANVNAFSALVLSFCLAVLYGIRRKALAYSVAFAAGVSFYWATDSRTLLFGIGLFLVFEIGFALFHNHPMWIRSGAVVVAMLPLGLTIFAARIVESVPLLDLALSGRSTLVATYLDQFSLLNWLFGGVPPPADYAVDNAFGLLMGAGGFCLLAFLTMAYLRCLFQAIRCADTRSFAFLMTFWLVTFSESSMVRPESISCFIFWLLLAQSPEKVRSK